MDVEKIVREYIDKSWHMSLATVNGGRPWVCEVHFGYDDKLNLYFVSKRATRHCQEIATNPHVAGNIVRQHKLIDAPNGVYFEGTAKLLQSPTREEINAYCDRLGRDTEELHQHLAEGTSGMYKIGVANWAVFGKFGGEKNQKCELSWDGKMK